MVDFRAGSIQPFVRKLESLVTLPETDRACLDAIGVETRVVAGETDLVREGQPFGTPFVLLRGFACRYTTSEGGTRHIMSYILPGDLCDLDGSLLGRMDHSIATLSECCVGKISAETIRDMLGRPAIARALRMAALMELSNARGWIVNIGGRYAVARLSHLLCEMHARLETAGLVEGNAFYLPLTQIDLADATGMSLVHMNRSIKELKETGLIEWKSKRLRILDLPSLQERCGFGAAALVPGDTSPAPVTPSRSTSPIASHHGKAGSA